MSVGGPLEKGVFSFVSAVYSSKSNPHNKTIREAVLCASVCACANLAVARGDQTGTTRGSNNDTETRSDWRLPHTLSDHTNMNVSFFAVGSIVNRCLDRPQTQAEPGPMRYDAGDSHSLN